jgi:hypothetical protein
LFLHTGIDAVGFRPAQSKVFDAVEGVSGQGEAGGQCVKGVRARGVIAACVIGVCVIGRRGFFQLRLSGFGNNNAGFVDHNQGYVDIGLGHVLNADAAPVKAVCGNDGRSPAVPQESGGKGLFDKAVFGVEQGVFGIFSIFGAVKINGVDKLFFFDADKEFPEQFPRRAGKPAEVGGLLRAFGAAEPEEAAAPSLPVMK